MSDTPRTDAVNKYLRTRWSYSKTDNEVWMNHGAELERELNAANDRIKRLEEAGDEIIWAFCPASVSMMTERESDALKLWNKAKEAKP